MPAHLFRHLPQQGFRASQTGSHPERASPVCSTASKLEEELEKRARAYQIVSEQLNEAEDSAENVAGNDEEFEKRGRHRSRVIFVGSEVILNSRKGRRQI